MAALALTPDLTPLAEGATAAPTDTSGLAVPISAVSQPWPTDIARPATPTCNPGETVNAPVTAVKIAYGGTVYLYGNTATGVAENIVPPTSFNPVTAADDELATFNYPPRPTDPAQMARWTADALDYKGQGVPEICSSPSIASNQSASTGKATVTPFIHAGNSIYGGYENIAGGYQKATTNLSMWNDGTAGRWVSAWAGLTSDGSSTSVLVQAGVGRDAGTAYTFWELFCGWSSQCNGAQRVVNQSFGAGDNVGISVSFNPATHLSYYRVTTNGFVQFNLQYPTPSNATTGKDVLWVVEKGGNGTLGDFQTLNWQFPETYAVWNSSTYKNMVATTYQALTLTSDSLFHAPPCSSSTKLLAYPENPTTSGFDIRWCRSS